MRQKHLVKSEIIVGEEYIVNMHIPMVPALDTLVGCSRGYPGFNARQRAVVVARAGVAVTIEYEQLKAVGKPLHKRTEPLKWVPVKHREVVHYTRILRKAEGDRKP